MEATLNKKLTYADCPNWTEKCFFLLRQRKTASAKDIAALILEKEPSLEAYRAQAIAEQHLSLLHRVGSLNASRTGRHYIYSVK